MRRFWSRAVMAALAAAPLAACGGGADAPSPAADGGDYDTIGGGPPGGVLVALLDGEPDDLNPVTYSSLPASQAIHLMFRSLAWRDSTLSNYRPDLAESWEMRPDSVLVVRLRDDVRWHDGTPVTADDVAFTLDRQRDPVVASPRQSDVSAVRSVTVVDSVTLEIGMSRTGAYAVNALLEVVPVPKHLLENEDPSRFRMATFGQAPVGNGYFRFGRWDRGQQLILDVNTERPEGRVALDRVVMRFVPDINAALTDLLAGQADLLKIPPEHKEQVEASRATALHSAPRVRPAWVAWNTTTPPLDDVRVRQAILMAVNREAIARGLFGEVGEAAYSPLPPALWEHSADVEPIPFDPARARGVLEQAGWRDTDGDGIRDRNGVPLRIQVDYNSAEQLRQDVLVAMQSMVRDVGVDLVPRAYERTAWVERLRSREFAGSSWGWGWGPGVVGPNAEAILHSRSIPPAGPNFAGYRNPRVDELIDSSLSTRDTAQLRAIWREIEQIVIDEVPYAPIYLDPELFGVSSRFANVRFRGIEWWEDIVYWYLPVEGRLPRDRTE